MVKNPIPRGHWESNGVIKDINTMDLEEIRAIVDERSKKRLFIHPLMLKRLNLPVTPRAYVDSPRGPKVLRNTFGGDA